MRCDADTVDLLRPMDQYFERMARAKATDWGDSVEPPATHAKVDLSDMDVFVDLQDFIDVEAEIATDAAVEHHVTLSLAVESPPHHDEKLVIALF